MSVVLEFYQKYGFVPETFPSHQGKIKYIKPLSKCKYDSILSLLKRQESLDKKYNLLSVTTWHEFSHVLHDKPINKETFFYDRDYL